jgi:hypothetical protein
MKTALGTTMAMLLLALSGCATITRETPPPLPARHAILTGAQAQVGSGYWQPAEKDIATLEEQLSRIWVSGGRGLERPPIRPLSEYVVRYSGQTINGRRVIVGGGAARSEVQEADWLLERPNAVPMHAFGGGENYFTVTFDFEAQRVTRVQVNAPL